MCHQIMATPFDNMAGFEMNATKFQVGKHTPGANRFSIVV